MPSMISYISNSLRENNNMWTGQPGQVRKARQTQIKRLAELTLETVRSDLEATSHSSSRQSGQASQDGRLSQAVETQQKIASIEAPITIRGSRPKNVERPLQGKPFPPFTRQHLAKHPARAPCCMPWDSSPPRPDGLPSRDARFFCPRGQRGAKHTPLHPPRFIVACRRHLVLSSFTPVPSSVDRSRYPSGKASLAFSSSSRGRSALLTTSSHGRLGNRLLSSCRTCICSIREHVHKRQKREKSDAQKVARKCDPTG